MKKILFIFYFIFLNITAFASVFDFKIEKTDLFGDLTIVDTKQNIYNGKDALAVLADEYSNKNFNDKLNQALEGNDINDLLVLCAIWQHIATISDRRKLENLIVKKTTGVDFSRIHYGLALREAGWGSLETIDSDLSAFLHLITVNKMGHLVVGPSENEGEPLVSPLFRASLTYFLFYFKKYDPAGEDAKIIERMMNYVRTMSNYSNNPNFFESPEQKALFRIFSHELDVLPKYKEPEILKDILQNLPENHHAVRLIKAIELQKTDKKKADEEILALGKEFFAPAYFFVEKINLKNKNFAEAAYYHYLQMKNPICPRSSLEKGAEFFYENNNIVSRQLDFLDLLIKAKMQDEAIRYAAYLRFKSLKFHQNISVYLSNEIRAKIARFHGDIVSSQIKPFLKNPFYQNDDFERRYMESLRGLKMPLAKEFLEKELPVVVVPVK